VVGGSIGGRLGGLSGVQGGRRIGGRVRAGGCRVFGSEITGANATGSDGCCTGGAGVRGVRGFLGFEQAGHDFPSFIPWRMRAGAFGPSGVHFREIVGSFK